MILDDHPSYVNLTPEDWAEFMAELNENNGWDGPYADEAPEADLAATYEPTPEDREWADRHLDPAPEPKPKRARKAKAPKVTEAAAPSMTLTIRGTAYGIEPLASPDGRAWRLTKGEGKVYDVAEGPYGPTCDCPDFIYRRDGNDRHGCKHIRGLRAFGLVSGVATPLPAPVPAGQPY
jgi:hypothetical protein